MQRTRSWRIGTSAVALALATGAASADELINTGNPGGFLGYFGFDIFVGQSVAIAFTPTSTCRLDNVKLWIMSNDFDAAGRTYNLSLRAAHASVPTIPGSGTIETWNVSTSAIGWTPVQETSASVLRPTLSAGTRYWIVAESNEPAGVDPVWLSCDGVGNHVVAFNDFASGTGWQGAEQQGGFPGIIINATAAGPARCNAADVAGVGGTAGPDLQLTADDIIVYLGAFFAGELSVADLAGLGGSAGADGTLTPDDMVFFLAAFFSPCAP